jgi:hypothetical protein
MIIVDFIVVYNERKFAPASVVHRRIALSESIP